jgi:hypothetical protein
MQKCCTPTFLVVAILFTTAERMNTFSRLVTAMTLLASGPLLAQQPSYSYSLTEPDQELDDFSGGYAKIHKISASLRGVRGADRTLYWVSPDGRLLTAYRRGKRLWQINLNQFFAHLIRDVKVDKLVFSSNVIFVFTAKGGHAEIDRTTGKVGAVGVDAD